MCCHLPAPAHLGALHILGVKVAAQQRRVQAIQAAEEGMEGRLSTTAKTETKSGKTVQVATQKLCSCAGRAGCGGVKGRPLADGENMPRGDSGLG